MSDEKDRNSISEESGIEEIVEEPALEGTYPTIVLPKLDDESNFDVKTLEEKFKLFTQTYNSETWWKNYSNKNGIELKVYEGEGSHSGVFGTYEIPYNNDVIMQVISQPELCLKMNSFGEKFEHIEKLGELTNIWYMKFKGLLMVSGRDFICLTTQTTMLTKGEEGKGFSNKFNRHTRSSRLGYL